MPLDSGQVEVVILGSERGVRRLDPTQSLPLALADVTPESTLLEWNLAALSSSRTGPVRFVGGYHIQKVVERFPLLSFIFHTQWETEGAVAALKLALKHTDPNSSLLILAGDVLLRPEAVAKLTARSEAIAVGGALSSTTEPRRCEILLIRSGARADLLAALDQAGRSGPRAGLSSLVERLMRARPDAANVDLTGLCASIRQPRDVASFVMGTKAQTLERLAPLITEAIIPPIVSFTVGEWRRDPAGVESSVRRSLGECSLVVRSSSLLEDLFHSSSAGKFHSELDVSISDFPGAVDRVIESYVRHAAHDHALLDDQVLVQPYVREAAFNGVVFTRVPDDRSPYLVLNYEQVEGRTDTVTAGQSRDSRTVIRARSAPTAHGDTWQARVLRLARRLEELTHHDGLDIEFVVDSHDRVYLLQVRPIAASEASVAAADGDIDIEVGQIKAAVARHVGPVPWLLGKRGALGVMPDWNPAEIIGVCPRPLALSLYRHVITDSTWARARAEMGYRDLAETPLLYALGGRPYIDVRASINSFLPRDLPDELGARVVDAAIDSLEVRPELHDKIEFELVPTCLDADADRWRRYLVNAGLSETDASSVLDSCAELTDRIIAGRPMSISDRLESVRRMSEHRALCLQNETHGAGANLAVARRLLSGAKELGTLPFAALARAAFIAMSLLRSFVRIGVITQRELDELFGAIPTVASDVSRELGLVRRGEMSRSAFLERCGHLRPGTYDILSPSYAECPEQYLGEPTSPRLGSDASSPHDPTDARDFLRSREREIGQALRTAGLRSEASAVIEFILAAIPAREFAKFEFTKNLSAALCAIAAAGKEFDLSRDDLSHLTIDRLLQLSVETPSAAERTELHRIVGLYRKRHLITTSLRLPQLIFTPACADGFTISAMHPNFITRARTHGPGRFLRVNSGQTLSSDAMAGAVVLIENADPGYDWVFSHPIAGLVTKYGGVASHMAIRAAEFRIPAAIGCGELIFNPLKAPGTIELDCAAERVRRVA